MKPILYDANETAFDSNGIGVLADAIECRVAEELNGKYELTLRYPTAGIHYDRIVRRAIILAKPDPVSQPQPFRIYRRMPTSNGVVTVCARHISYDLSGVMVSPFSASGVGAALQGFTDNAVNECPFTFWTDKSATGNMAVTVPSTVRSLLGGSAGSVLDVFGGEYQFDRFTVKLWSRRGADRGVTIRYGKNLTSLEMDENVSNCYTGVYPYWMSSEGLLVQLPERIVEAPGEFDHVRIMPLDLSLEWQEAPTEEQLRERAEKYIADNNIGTPSVPLKLSYVDLEQTEEYKGKAPLERVLLGDTVAAEFPDMGVPSSSRVVAADYDSIMERYNSVTLGKVKANIADTIAGQNKEIADRPNKSAMQVSIEQLTSSILGARGGAVRLLDENGDGMPDTLYIADNPDPALAVKVWRFNYEGWGASNHGYNGPFVLGATIDVGMFANFIRGDAIVAEGRSILPPTHDDVSNMLWALLFPDRFEVKNFYDLNGDGVFDNQDVALANDIYMGIRDISEAHSLKESRIEVLINPSNTEAPVKISGVNMWGSQVDMLIGINGSKIPRIVGDCAVSGRLSVGNYAVFSKLALNNLETPKSLEWKDNGDGTFTLIGREVVSQ